MPVLSLLRMPDVTCTKYRMASRTEVSAYEETVISPASRRRNRSSASPTRASQYVNRACWTERGITGVLPVRPDGPLSTSLQPQARDKF